MADRESGSWIVVKTVCCSDSILFELMFASNHLNLLYTRVLLIIYNSCKCIYLKNGVLGARVRFLRCNCRFLLILSFSYTSLCVLNFSLCLVCVSDFSWLCRDSASHFRILMWLQRQPTSSPDCFHPRRRRCSTKERRGRNRNLQKKKWT